MFSWSNGSGSKTYPGRRSQNERRQGGSGASSSGGYTRAQHLKSYIEDDTLKRSTRRVSSDDTTYDTVFQTTKGDTLILRVNLPLTSSIASFCPAMSLAGIRCKHPWVEPQRMRITGYDPIQSERHWNECGLLLGNAVHDVVKYLQLNPPQVLEFTDPGLESVQSRTKQQQQQQQRKQHQSPPRNGTNGHHHHHHQPHPAEQEAAHANGGAAAAPPSYDSFSNHQTNPEPPEPPAPDVPLPTIPNTFPTVDTMDREALESNLKDDDTMPFLAFVQALPLYEELQALQNSKLEEVQSLAEENASKEAELIELHQTVASKQKELAQKIAAFASLEQEQNDLCRPPDKKVTLKRLNKAKREAFDQSEEYAEEWIEDGAASVDDFVKEFVQLRKVHHLRGAKMEVLENATQQI